MSIDPQVLGTLDSIQRRVGDACADYLTNDSRFAAYQESAFEVSKLPQELQASIASLVGTVGLVFHLEGIAAD